MSLRKIFPQIFGGMLPGAKFLHWIDTAREANPGIQGKINCARSAHRKWKEERRAGYTPPRKYKKV